MTSRYLSRYWLVLAEIQNHYLVKISQKLEQKQGDYLMYEDLINILK